MMEILLMETDVQVFALLSLSLTALIWPILQVFAFLYVVMTFKTVDRHVTMEI
jgi:hypothetical protein